MKRKRIESVIKPWVSRLPFTQQALLMLSLRGPDGVSKYSGAKYLLYYLRDAILKPAYEYDGAFEPGGFMRADLENFNQVMNDFFSDVDGYPMHFLMHLIHAAEVVGYNHPHDKTRECWFNFYLCACASLHMNPETRSELNSRLKV